MTVVIPAGFAQCIYSIERTGDPELYQVIFGVGYDEAADLQDVADSLQQAFDVALADQMNNGQRLVLTTAQTATDIATNDTISVGEVSANDLPPNCAVLVRKTSALRGRPHRGRNYWPGFVAEQSVDGNGVIESDDLSGLQAAFSTWFNQLLLDLTPLCILHDETSPASTPTLVTNVTVQAVIATQRRRLRR